MIQRCLDSNGISLIHSKTRTWVIFTYGERELRAEETGRGWAPWWRWGWFGSRQRCKHGCLAPPRRTFAAADGRWARSGQIWPPWGSQRTGTHSPAKRGSTVKSVTNQDCLLTVFPVARFDSSRIVSIDRSTPLLSLLYEVLVCVSQTHFILSWDSMFLFTAGITTPRWMYDGRTTKTSQIT